MLTPSWVRWIPSTERIVSSVTTRLLSSAIWLGLPRSVFSMDYATNTSFSPPSLPVLWSSAVCPYFIFLLLLSFQIQILPCSQTPSVCVPTLRVAVQVVNPHLTVFCYVKMEALQSVETSFSVIYHSVQSSIRQALILQKSISFVGLVSIYYENMPRLDVE